MTKRPPRSLPSVPELTAEYLLLSEIGRGGSAVVYLARDRELEREVAIKLVRTPVNDDESRARFSREARTAALLHHPNIVGVHSVKRLSDGGLALVMQYVPGRTLKQLLRQGGPLDFEQVERVIRDVAAALAYAHDRGVVHRDVKPENIFIHEGEDRALLADFGIARTAESHSGITLEGVAIGTPAYMAPEHIDGSHLDGRADLYSLGMVAWEMMTGEAPWEGESLYSIVYKQKHAELPSVEDYRSEVPFHLWYAVEQLTRKDRDRRLPDARALVDSLERFREASPWRRWWVRRGLQRPTGEPNSPPLAIPPGILSTIESTPPAVRSAEATDDGATVRYRRSEVSPASVPLSSDAVEWPQDGPNAESALAQARVREEPAVPASLLLGPDEEQELGSDADPKLFLRRVPAASFAVAVALFLGVGATLFALGSPGFADEQVSAFRPPTERTSPGATPAPVLSPSLETAEVVEPPFDPEENAGYDEAELGLDEPEIVRLTLLIEEPVEEAPAEEELTPPEEEEFAPAPAPPPVVHRFAARPIVSAGGLHTCSVGPDGAAHCWGGNAGGQVGDGGTSRSPSPVRLTVNETFRDIAAGFSHTCGVTTDGQLMCWGANESGQLGVGSGGQRAAPARVTTTREFESVTTGRSHSCALSADGEAYCWGLNTFGQLGDRSRSSRATPVRVAAESGFSRISAGWNHTCGITFRGAVLCWGQNAEGQLGNDATSDHVVPMTVVGRRSFSRISAGGAHTCAIASDGAAFCWGGNAHGQLGDGSTIRRTVPVPVEARVGFQEITAGGVHTCALTREGVAYCWGRNVYGQVGDGSTTDRLVPTRVDTRQRFVTLHASGSHTCGTTSAGERYCWGYNLEGQLGDGSRSHQTRPVAIAAPRD